MIVQGDQLFIQFVVTQDGAYITPENVDDIRISVDGVEKRYSSGDLAYDFENNVWMYFLRTSDSKDMNSKARCQIEIKKGLIRQHSAVFVIDVWSSVQQLKSEW